MSAVYGTANQNKYVKILRRNLGDKAVDDATRKVLGLDGTEAIPELVPVEHTSAIIDALKDQAPKARSGMGGQKTGAVKMSGRELLALANLDNPVPAGMDRDMLKVVSRLRRLAALMQITASPDKPLALNGQDPIRIATLVDLLGNTAEVAKALGVNMKTVEGWGEYLPDSHESRAELVTRGGVKARLPS